MDASIILGGRPLDVVGALRQGNAAAMETNQIQQQNALAQLYRTQGAGIMQGKPQSLNALAQFDPQAALGIQGTRMDMQATQQRMDMMTREEQQQIEALKATKTQAELAAAAARIEDAVKMGLAIQTPQQWDMLMQQQAPELVGQFDNRQAFAMKYMSMAEALKATTPDVPKPQSPQAKFEADKAAGLLPPDAVYKSDAPSVTVNNGGGKFDEAFAKADADTLSSVATAGQAAIRNAARINQLDALLSTAPTGATGALQQIAGEWGIPTQGLDDLQAAQAIINSLVPEQRQPGSGPMSDADLALFKQSLPRIINQPGGNKTIVNTMRAIAQYDAEGARIVQDLRAGRIDRATAFDQLQNRANPLANVNAVASTAAPAQPSIPAGAIDLLKQNNTPEYRKFFDDVFGQGAAAQILGGN